VLLGRVRLRLTAGIARQSLQFRFDGFGELGRANGGGVAWDGVRLRLTAGHCPPIVSPALLRRDQGYTPLPLVPQRNHGDKASLNHSHKRRVSYHAGQWSSPSCSRCA